MENDSQDSDEEWDARSRLLQHPSKSTKEQANSEDDFTAAISTSNNSSIKISGGFRKSICFKLIILSIPIVIIVIVSVSFFTGVAIYSVGVKDNYLGIASDVIQCAQHHWSHVFSTMIIEQNNSDTINDNPNGLVIDVFSLDQKDLIFHDFIDDHTDFEIILPTSGVNRFIVPYNYYNRPWYLWPESTISMEFNINISNESPTQAFAYLYRGEKAINDFFASSQTQPSYEEKVDLIATTSRNIIWTSINTADYYFVAIEINGEQDTVFKANISFTVLYVDVDDYSFLPTTSKKLVGVLDGLKLGWSRSSNLTLCYLHPQNNPLYSNSIHLDVSYQPNVALPATLAPIFGLVLVYVVVLVTWCVFIRHHSRVHYKGYISINSNFS